MNRLALTLIAGAAFGGAGQWPLIAQMPAAQENSLVAPKPAAPVQPPRPSLPAATPQPLGSGPNTGAAIPEQTKILMTYRGSGHFDGDLALKLRPFLARKFGLPTPAAKGKTLPDWLKSVFGQGASTTSSHPGTFERTGQP